MDWAQHFHKFCSTRLHNGPRGLKYVHNAGLNVYFMYFMSFIVAPDIVGFFFGVLVDEQKKARPHCLFWRVGQSVK